MIEYDIIGGPEDGHKVYTTKRPPQVTIHLGGQTYMSIQFPKSPGGKEQVFAYMICGMTPQEAVAIWRLRQEKAKLLRDEDSGSMLCPACGGYEEHKGECKG